MPAPVHCSLRMSGYDVAALLELREHIAQYAAMGVFPSRVAFVRALIEAGLTTQSEASLLAELRTYGYVNPVRPDHGFEPGVLYVSELARSTDAVRLDRLRAGERVRRAVASAPPVPVPLSGVIVRLTYPQIRELILAADDHRQHLHDNGAGCRALDAAVDRLQRVFGSRPSSD